MGESHNIPNNWEIVTISEIGTSVTGNTPPTKDMHNYGGSLPYIKPPQLIGGIINNSTEHLSENGVKLARVLPPSSILVSCIGNLGKVGLTKVPVAFNQQINAIIPRNEILAEYLFYQAQSHAFRSQLESMATSTTISIVNKGNFETIKINIAPLSEQHRIVAKIEELLSELDKGVENLSTAQQQLKVYRQALLKHAFEGKLTADWRAQNPDKLESADALLARIQQERAARYQQQLQDWQTAQKDWEANGKMGSKPSKPKAPKALPPLTTEELKELPELPLGWQWVKVSDLAAKITDGEHFKPDTQDSGIYFLSAKDVQSSGVIFDNPLFISPETAAKARLRCDPERNDILIVSRGATVGRMCIVDTDKVFCLLGSVILIKPLHAASNSYLLFSLKSPLINKKIVSISGSTAQQAIYLRDIQHVAVPYCSLDEQQEISKMLDEKLSIIDALEASLDSELTRAEALRQSILKKAFSGQLVAQDPNDEPASVLLERIRAERATQPKARGRKARASA